LNFLSFRIVASEVRGQDVVVVEVYGMLQLMEKRESLSNCRLYFADVDLDSAALKDGGQAATITVLATQPSL